jgi:hypothetical protein
MAFTLTSVYSESEYLTGGDAGGRVVVYGWGTCGTSYTTGGESVTIAIVAAAVSGGLDASLASIVHVQVGGVTEDGVNLISYDVTNSKVQAWTALTTEVAATTDLSADAKRFPVTIVVDPGNS